MQTEAQPRAIPVRGPLDRRTLGMIRFSHTLFALPFALLGGALAAWSPDGLAGSRAATGWAS